MSDGGKRPSPSPRPYSVSHEKFADNWKHIFGKKNKSTTKDNQKKDRNERTLDRKMAPQDN